MDSLAIFFAEYFIYFLVAGAILFFFLIKGKNRLKYLILSGFSVILSRIAITELIRLIWHRPRPFLIHRVNQLLEHGAEGSFPSGHVVFLFALGTVIYFFNKKIGILFLIGSFLVGIARVFVGIHYPLDILGGVIIGVLSAVFIKFLFKKR